MPPKKTTNLTFGEATARANEGLAVAREAWGNHNMFAYVIPNSDRKAHTEVEKKFFGEEGVVRIKEHWVLKTIHDEVIPWNPYGTDVLAKDWKIVEIKPKEYEQ